MTSLDCLNWPYSYTQKSVNTEKKLHVANPHPTHNCSESLPDPACGNKPTARGCIQESYHFCAKSCRLAAHLFPGTWGFFGGGGSQNKEADTGLWLITGTHLASSKLKNMRAGAQYTKVAHNILQKQFHFSLKENLLHV